MYLGGFIPQPLELTPMRRLTPAHFLFCVCLYAFSAMISLMSTIFTKIINREIPADIVYEDDVVVAFLDIRPVKKGHVLVVPKKEFENIFDGDPEILAHMMRVAQKIGKSLIKAVGAQGVNLVMNNGEEAGQEVPHAHLHIIPRFKKGEVFTPTPHEEYEKGECSSCADAIKQNLI